MEFLSMGKRARQRRKSATPPSTPTAAGSATGSAKTPAAPVRNLKKNSVTRLKPKQTIAGDRHADAAVLMVSYG